jgi:hypothetical protein
VINTDSIIKSVAAVTGLMAAIGGGYSLYEKVKLPPKDILKWDAEHFSITSGPASGQFKVVVARQKIRDDCTVEDFSLEVRDSDYMVHKANPSVAKFSGPATPTVDKFGYTMTVEKPEGVALGDLLAEGEVAAVVDQVIHGVLHSGGGGGRSPRLVIRRPCGPSWP